MKEILDAFKPILFEVSNPIDNKYDGKYTIEKMENAVMQWKEFISREDGKNNKKNIKIDGVDKETFVKEILTSKRKIIKKDDDGEEKKFVFEISIVKTHILEKKEPVEYKDIDEEKSTPGNPVYKKDAQGIEVVKKQDISYTYLYEEVIPDYKFEQFVYKTDFFSTAYRVTNYSDGKEKEKLNFTFVNKTPSDNFFSSPNFQFIDIENYENVPNKFFDSLLSDSITDPILETISNLCFHIYTHNNGTPTKQLNNIYYNHHYSTEIIDSNKHLHFNDINPFAFLMSLSRKYLPISWQINKKGTDMTFDIVFAKILTKELENSIIFSIPKAISVKESVGYFKKLYVEEAKDIIKRELSKYYARYKFTLSEYKKDNEVKITDSYKLLKHFVKVKFEWPENIWKAWPVWAAYEQNIYNLHSHLFEDVEYETAAFIIKLGFILGLQAHIDNSDYKSSSKKGVSKISIDKDRFSKMNIDFFSDISDNPDKRQVMIDNFNKIFMGGYDDVKSFNNEITLQNSVTKQEDVIKQKFFGKDKKSIQDKDPWIVPLRIGSVLNALNPLHLYSNTPRDAAQGFLSTALLTSATSSLLYGAGYTTSNYASSALLAAAGKEGVGLIGATIASTVGLAETSVATVILTYGAPIAVLLCVIAAINTDFLYTRTIINSGLSLAGKFSNGFIGALIDTLGVVENTLKQLTTGNTGGMYELRIEDEKVALEEYKQYKKTLKTLKVFRNVLYFLTNFGAFDIYGDMSVTLSDLKDVIEKVENLQNINDVHKLFEVLSVSFTGKIQNIKYVVIEQQTDKKEPTVEKKSTKKSSTKQRNRKTFIQLYKYDLSLYENFKSTETLEVYCSLESMSKLFQRDIKSNVYELMNFFNLDNYIENYLLIKLHDKKTNESSYWIYGHMNNVQTQAQTYYVNQPYELGKNPFKYLYSLFPSKNQVMAVANLQPIGKKTDPTEETKLRALLDTKNFGGIFLRKQKIYDINLKKTVLVNLSLKGTEIIKNNSYTIIKTSTDATRAEENYLTKNSMTFNEEENFKKVQRAFNNFLKMDYGKVNVIPSKNSITNIKRELYWVYLQKYYSIYNTETNNVMNLKNDMITKVITKLGNCNKPLETNTELKTSLVENVLTESMKKLNKSLSVKNNKEPSNKSKAGKKLKTKKNLKSK